MKRNETQKVSQTNTIDKYHRQHHSKGYMKQVPSASPEICGKQATLREASK